MFEWARGIDKKRYSSFWEGPFAITQRPEGSWALLLNTVEGVFEVKIAPVERTKNEQDKGDRD